MKDRWGAHRADTKYFRESEFSARLKLLRWLGRQTWIPKGQNRLLYSIMMPENAPDYSFEVEFFGSRYRGNLSDFIDWMVFVYGSYQREELTLLKDAADYLRTKRGQPITFVDVGANSGHHTLFMSRIADQTIAFEPHPGLVQAFEARVSLNQLTNVRIMPFALGAKDETRDFYLETGPNAGTGTFVPNDHEAKVTPMQLRIRRGDDVFDEEGVPRIDLMKVDVEGFELAVFDGLQRRIRSDFPIILAELSQKAWEQFGSEQAFKSAFYEGARFAAVKGRAGRNYKLGRFRYGANVEVLVVPPQYAEFARGL
jgi:FkbM family methyltransferase